mgnify:CR=1 FL=1
MDLSSAASTSLKHSEAVSLDLKYLKKLLQSTTVTHVSNTESSLRRLPPVALGSNSDKSKVKVSATCIGSLIPVLSITR